ncbi:hypothetical protein PI124_g6741 [Phytophthora idaei]|nr:hypothetical protein PI124_g6741 [Phytophthora idaei]
MHCAVEDKRLEQRLLSKKRECGENLVNFTVGDYVLRSRVDEKQSNKIQVTWVGPYRVVRADTHSFRVQHLLTVTDELPEHISAQGIVLAVDKLKDHQWNGNIKAYEIKVRWKGLQPVEDSDEPMTDLAKEIRVLMGNYVKQTDDQELYGFWQKLQQYDLGMARERHDAGRLVGNDDVKLQLDMASSRETKASTKEIKQVWGRPRLVWLGSDNSNDLQDARRGREPQSQGTERNLVTNGTYPFDISGTVATAASRNRLRFAVTERLER